MNLRWMLSSSRRATLRRLSFRRDTTGELEALRDAWGSLYYVCDSGVVVIDAGRRWLAVAKQGGPTITARTSRELSLKLLADLSARPPDGEPDGDAEDADAQAGAW